MKVYESSFNYDYAFPTVTLAYFLRYPNPYARHVESTDVIDRYVDPETQRLHTTRLHLKKSKVPAGILAFLPRGLAGPGGSSKSFVLETSTIDLKEGWMETQSKNMEWTGILSVIERQRYKRIPLADDGRNTRSTADVLRGSDQTFCKTSVTFVSKLGQAKYFTRKRASTTSTSEEEETPKQGFFASWSTAGIQRTVELVGVKRTKTALVNGKAGMNVVLERLRNGGIIGVLEGMRQDRMEMGGEPVGPLKVLLSGRNVGGDGRDRDSD